MAILLSDIAKEDLNYKMDESHTLTPTQELVKAYEGMSDEYNQIVIEFLQAQLLAVRSDNPLSISMESVSDTAASIREWFVKWLSRFRKFIRDTLEKMSKKYNSGNMLVRKYMKELPVFNSFKVQGSKYTIAPTELEVHEIRSVISTIRNGYIRIMRAGKDELNAVAAAEIALIQGTNVMDDIRGKITHQPAMPNDMYRRALHDMFRNNTPIPETIVIDRNKLVAMCREYDSLKALFPAMKKNKESLETVTNEIIDFLTKQPNALREYHRQNSIFNNSYLTKYPNAPITGARMDFEDLLKRKIAVLSRYFAAANTTLKQIQLMYDLYFTEKIGAINEAMAFYTHCIEKAFRGKVNEA